MSDYKLQTSLLEYVTAATDLADCVKYNIMHSKNGVAVIDDKTVVALNNFRIAANAIADFPLMLQNNTNKFN